MNEFKENNIVLRFGVLSDIHISDKENSLAERKFYNAVDYLNRISNDRLDGIIMPGDLTDHGFDIEIDNLERAFSKTIKDKVIVAYTLGNHDLWAGTQSPKQFINRLDNRFNNGIVEGSLFHRHIVIGGYHFLLPLADEYIFTESIKFKEDTLAWLDRELNEITTHSPSKYVFVIMHPSIEGTTFHASGAFWASENIDTVLKKYPQVIAITGHMHIPQQHEQGIYQKDYTVIGCGCVLYTIIENIYVQTRKTSFHPKAWDSSQGSYYEIDEVGNVRITKLNFVDNTTIKEPWILKSPMPDLSHLNNYRHERFDNTFPPVFPIDAEISAKYENGFTKLTFSTAKDDDFVLDYHITIKRNNEVVFDDRFVTDYFMVSNPSDMGETLTVELENFQITKGDVISVVASNTFKKLSTCFERVYSN